MAKSSIHIEAGSGGYFAHNSREAPTVNSVFSDEQNFCSCSKEDAFKLYRSELQIRSEAYTERTGQKLQKNAITHLSAIVNFNKDHTPEDMQRVCDLLERKFDTKVIQYAMHRDEGKSADDKNYHAHIEFMGLDSKGESVRRKLDRPTLKALQSEVAQTLGMTRGKDYAKERTPRPKRLDTYEYKAHAKAVEEVKIATEKDLKAEVAQLRSQLKEQGATRADYAELEKINRELQEQIKAKDLTVDQLTTQLETVRSLNRYAESEKAELKAQIITKDETIDQLKSIPKEVQKEFIQDPKIVQENSELRKEIAELKEAKTATVSNDTDLAKRQKETMWEVEASIKYFMPPHLPNEPVKKEELDAKAQEIEKLKARATPQFGMKMIEHCCNAVGWPDKEKLSKIIASEMRKGVDVADDSLKLGYKLHDFKDRAIEAVKSAVKSSKTTLENIFTKIAGKSLSEVENERVEAKNQRLQEIEDLREKLGHRSELTKDLEKPFSFKDFEKEQEREEPKKSQSMGLGR